MSKNRHTHFQLVACTTRVVFRNRLFYVLVTGSLQKCATVVIYIGSAYWISLYLTSDFCRFLCDTAHIFWSCVFSTTEINRFFNRPQYCRHTSTPIKIQEDKKWMQSIPIRSTLCDMYVGVDSISVSCLIGRDTMLSIISWAYKA